MNDFVSGAIGGDCLVVRSLPGFYLLLLADEQFSVVEASNDLLGAIGSDRPAFALLDIGMPDVDGCEVARRLRSELWAADLTLVALTGYGPAEDRVKSVAAGFDHHLSKPVNSAELNVILAERRSA